MVGSRRVGPEGSAEREVPVAVVESTIEPSSLKSKSSLRSVKENGRSCLGFIGRFSVTQPVGEEAVA